MAIVASGSAVAEEIADDLLSAATALYQSGAYFRLRVVDVFEEARRMAAAAHLEIIRPRRGQSQFLFGDVPAISVGPGGQPLVSLAVCHSAMRPRSSFPSARRGSPLSAVRTGSRPCPLAAIRRANAFQVAKAHDYVYMHPGSGLQAFVASERPPTGPVRL